MAEQSVIKKAVNAVSNFFGGEPEYDPDVDGVDIPDTGYDADADYPEEETSQGIGGFSNIFKGRNNSKIVAMPQPQAVMMKISKPTNLDEAYEIIGLLKEKNAVVLNLEYVSKDVARRIVDVVSGAIIALDGHFEKVSNSIFVAAPFNYDIVTDNSKDRSESKYAANFIK